MIGLMAVCPPCERAVAELLTGAEQALAVTVLLAIVLLILLMVGKLLRFVFAVRVVKPVKAQASAPVDVQATERQREFSWGSRQRDTRGPDYRAGRMPEVPPAPVAVVEPDWDEAALQKALIASRARAKNLQVEYDSHGQAMNVVRARNRK